VATCLTNVYKHDNFLEVLLGFWKILKGIIHSFFCKYFFSPKKIPQKKKEKRKKKARVHTV
jgi:hypothetical protein